MAASSVVRQRLMDSSLYSPSNGCSRVFSSTRVYCAWFHATSPRRYNCLSTVEKQWSHSFESANKFGQLDEIVTRYILEALGYYYILYGDWMIQ